MSAPRPGFSRTVTTSSFGYYTFDDISAGAQYTIANYALGENLMTQKRFAEAEPLLTESYNDLRNSQGEENPRTLLAKS